MPAKPLNTRVIFLDRSIDGNILSSALRQRGLQVVRHKERFADDSSDVEWLTTTGAEGWIAFTRDKNIRYREIERMALISAGVCAFVFTGGNVSGVELAETIVEALPRIERVLAKTKPPFICRITASGSVELIYPQPR